MSLSQIELVWVRVRLEWECFWMNLWKDNKVSESQLAVSESNMAGFKLAAIIKLIRLNEWSILYKWWRAKGEWSFFLEMVGTNLGKGESVWEEKLRWLNPRWWNSSWQNSRWLPSSIWVRMNEFESDWISLSQSFVQNGWIQDGRFVHGCDHQVESEWMSEVFFVQNGWIQDGRI